MSSGQLNSPLNRFKSRPRSIIHGTSTYRTPNGSAVAILATEDACRTKGPRVSDELVGCQRKQPEQEPRQQPRKHLRRQFRGHLSRKTPLGRQRIGHGLNTSAPKMLLLAVFLAVNIGIAGEWNRARDEQPNGLRQNKGPNAECMCAAGKQLNCRAPCHLHASSLGTHSAQREGNRRVCGAVGSVSIGNQ